MPLSRPLRLNVLVSSATILLTIASAQAQAQTQSVTRFTTFMHSGPGLQFSVTDEIPNRTPLQPECASGWCRVRYGNAFGWVEQSTLTSGPTTAQPGPGERPVSCADFARTGWPDSGNLERVCTFQAQKPLPVEKPGN